MQSACALSRPSVARVCDRACWIQSHPTEAIAPCMLYPSSLDAAPRPCVHPLDRARPDSAPCRPLPDATAAMMSGVPAVCMQQMWAAWQAGSLRRGEARAPTCWLKWSAGRLRATYDKGHRDSGHNIAEAAGVMGIVAGRVNAGRSRAKGMRMESSAPGARYLERGGVLVTSAGVYSGGLPQQD